MQGLLEQIESTCQVIQKKWQQKPRIGLILGTGLGRIVEDIQTECVWNFAELPHFAPSTALGHKGKFICGKWQGVDLVAMQGRLHFYEGYSLQEITFPVRVMNQLGVQLLIVTSASGGMHPQHHAGQLIVIDDHINLMGDNPLAGWNDDRLGPRYPDMSRPYDARLIERALKIGREKNLPVQRGVYVGVKGPNYETRAEYRFFRAIGGDVVGMSTVPETLVAVHGGMRVLGLSTVTNVCLPDALQPVTGDDVIEVADRSSRQMQLLIEQIIAQEAREQQQELFP